VPRAILGKLLVDLADSVSYRQSTRLPLVVPLTISGEDEGGVAFEEATQTIDVGKQGIRTLTLHRLSGDPQVRISGAALGGAQRARVVWQARTDSSHGRTEIGVEFLEPLPRQRMWTLETPPEDWLNGNLRLNASQKLEYFWVRMKSFPVSHELRALVESTKSLPVEDLDEFTPDGPGAQSAEPPNQVDSPRATKGAPEENRNSGNGIEPRLPASTGKSETATMSLAATPPPPGSPQILKGRTRPLSRTHARKGRGDFPVEELNQLAKTLAGQADTITKSVDEAWGSVRKTAEDALAQFSHAGHETESRLKELSAECESRIAGLGKSSADELRTQAEASLSGLRGEFQQIEARIRELQEDSHRQSAEHCAPSSNDVAANREAALAEFREQLERSLNEFRETAAQELQDLLRRGTASLREVSAMEQKELALKSAALQQGNEDFGSARLAQKAGNDTQPKKNPLGIVFYVTLLLAVATVVCGFAFFSTQPRWRLQATPPTDFFDSKVSRNMQPAEEELARAYWKCAVNVIQESYGLGTALPAQPPPGFSIEPQDAAKVRSKAYLEASRQRYWQKLQQLWNNPQVWVQTYQWNTDWFFSPLKTLGLKLRG
jgi:hypothetical protein